MKNKINGKKFNAHMQKTISLKWQYQNKLQILCDLSQNSTDPFVAKGKS